MKKGILYGCWAGLFILCAGLGFIPEPEGAARVLLVLAGVIFFVPGGVLLYRARQAGDVSELRRIRNLALASLVLTLAALVANFLTVDASEAAGQVLYAVLIVVSTPMVCSQYWILSMFLWACLMVASISTLLELRKKK